MTTFDTGLVIGKFCPLHLGHQRVLDQARAQCRRLVVISYTRPEFAGMEPERRERWLAALYPDAMRLVVDDERLADHCRQRGLEARRIPDNDDPDEIHRGFTAWLLHAILGVGVDAVFTSEAYGDGLAQSLTDAQRSRGGPHVVHVSVDPGRIRIPVSGTAARSDIHAHRHYLDPIVYRDFVQRVAILGGESTGKSTLAKQLAANLGTVHVAEYGRELWEQRNGALRESDMVDIARTQVAREQACADGAHRFVFCDTTPLTTLLYAQAMFGKAEPELALLAERPYHQVLLCAPDIPFVQDGTRRDEAFRQWQHAWYVRTLGERRIGYTLIHGDGQQRTAMAQRALYGD
jgi:HTH-type transcriptional repressor of NAD biosynthesis genes